MVAGLPAHLAQPREVPDVRPPPDTRAVTWSLANAYQRFAAALGRWPADRFLPPRRVTSSSRPSRIGYVFLLYPGLSDTFVRRELRALRARGVQVDVLARAPGVDAGAADAGAPAGSVTYFGGSRATGRRRLAGALVRRPGTVIRLWLFIVRHRDRHAKSWGRDLAVLEEAALLASMLAERGVTHVHAPWANHAALLSLVASRLLRLPFTVQARASEIHRTSEREAIADRVGFADMVVTNSHYNADWLRQHLGVSSTTPIRVIPNGLDPTQFHPAAGHVVRNGRPHIVSVGRLVEPKGFPLLLDALKLLRDRGVDFTGEIVGGAREPDDTVTWVQLRKRHTKYGLGDRVRFSGEAGMTGVIEAYRRADLFVLPCIRARDGSHDITPNSVIEAMAMGLPVISTRSGAITEIVDDGVDGLLVRPGDVDLLAAAIERLLRDARLRRSLGEAARRKVLERFDAERNVERRLAVFGLAGALDLS